MSNPRTAERNTLQKSHDQIHTVSTPATSPASATVGTIKRLLDYFQHLTFVRLRPRGVENSAHRRNGAAFFPNDFADVLLCHPKLERQRLPAGKPFVDTVPVANLVLAELPAEENLLLAAARGKVQ